MPVLPQRCQRLFAALATQWQHIGGGDTQIGRGTHLANSDRHPVQIRIVDIATVQNLGQGTPDQLADAQLALRRAAAAVMDIFRHGRADKPEYRALQQGFAYRTPSG